MQIDANIHIMEIIISYQSIISLIRAREWGLDTVYTISNYSPTHCRYIIISGIFWFQFYISVETNFLGSRSNEHNAKADKRQHDNIIETSTLSKHNFVLWCVYSDSKFNLLLLKHLW